MTLGEPLSSLVKLKLNGAIWLPARSSARQSKPIETVYWRKVASPPMFMVCTVFESFHVLGEFIRPSRLFDTRVNTVAVFIGSLNVIVIFVDDGTLIAPFAGVVAITVGGM